MSGNGPDAALVYTPLARLIRQRMAEENWELPDVCRPPDGKVKGGPARSTLSWHMQPGQWLRTMPRPETRAQLATGLRVDVADVTHAAYDSIEGRRDEDDQDESAPVGRGSDPDAMLALDGMTAEQRRQVRAYAEFIRSQNPDAR